MVESRDNTLDFNMGLKKLSHKNIIQIISIQLVNSTPLYKTFSSIIGFPFGYALCKRVIMTKNALVHEFLLGQCMHVYLYYYLHD